MPGSHGRGSSDVGLAGSRIPARYGMNAVTSFGSGGFSVHHRYVPNCHHSRPVARWCGSSNVCDSDEAEPTVHATAATTKLTVRSARAWRPCFVVIPCCGRRYHHPHAPTVSIIGETGTGSTLVARTRHDRRRRRPSVSVARGGHACARVGALAAYLRAALHLGPPELLARIGADAADLGAGATGDGMMLGAANHEIGAGPADVGTVE